MDEVALLAEVESGIEGLDVFKGDPLVDGHQGVHYLAADFLAGNLVVDIEVVRDRNDYFFGAGLSCVCICEPYASFKFLEVELFVSPIGFPYIHDDDSKI